MVGVPVESNVESKGKIDDTSTETAVECAHCSSTSAHKIFSVCLHSVCDRCAATVKVDDFYECPSCNERSQKLITNPLMTKSENIQKNPQCNWCNDNGEQTPSIGNCKECDAWLCGECLKGHNRMPPLRSHNITMLPKSVNEDGLRCEAHPHEYLECFCEACGVLTCRDCQLSVHRDHGSHRWVGEKALLLKSPLEEAVVRLTEYQTRLTSSTELIHLTRIDVNEGSFLGSIEQARRSIEQRTSSLIECIRYRTDALLKELDVKSKSTNAKLEAAEKLISELDRRIGFTLSFARRLITHTESDPASLVQLYDVVISRMDSLRQQADQLLEDDKEGWRTTADTRAVFFANWDPQDLAKHTGSVAWLPKPQHVPKQQTEDSVLQAAPPLVCNEQLLDALALSDNRLRYPDSSPVAGCAICFGAGLLAHCGACRRAYHLDCHLPRLTELSLVPGWVCGLCADAEAAGAAHVQQGKANCGAVCNVDVLAGCRILMGLLVHAEAVHFIAPVCPACSVPLLNPDQQMVLSCPAGHLYHRLAQLRWQLEKAAQKGGHQWSDVDDWLVEMDRFWSDAAQEGNHIPGTPNGCLRAARRLRAKLAALVRLHRPQSQLNLNQSGAGDDSEPEAAGDLNGNGNSVSFKVGEDE